jgi:hypothetical protein
MKPVSGRTPSDLTPISFLRPGTISATNAPLFTLTTAEASIKHTGGAKLNLGQPGIVSLANGETIIAANKPTTVSAGPYNIFIDTGTIAVITKDSSIVKVRNVYESKAFSLKAHVGKKSITVAAGHELLLGPNDGSLHKALKADPVGRRRIKNTDLPGGESIMTSEISLISLIQNTDVLRQLMNSDNAIDRRMAENLIKMAACITQVSSHRGSYSAVGR